jgi:hypothetical protein
MLHVFGFEVFILVTLKTTSFWDVTPCSLFESHSTVGRMYFLHHQGRRLSQENKTSRVLIADFLVLSSSLKMWAVYSSETSFNLYQTTRRHIPEHRILKLSNILCWWNHENWGHLDKLNFWKYRRWGRINNIRVYCMINLSSLIVLHSFTCLVSLTDKSDSHACQEFYSATKLWQTKDESVEGRPIRIGTENLIRRCTSCASSLAH